MNGRPAWPPAGRRDVLHYNRNRPAHYPNGWMLTDDVYDMRMAFMTYGRVISDGVEPHGDYLTEFPFLGLPNAQTSHASVNLFASDKSEQGLVALLVAEVA